MRVWPVLTERFDPHRNRLTEIRLVLAGTVALTHATELGFGHQPRIGHTRLSDLAVDAFFVLSGFLLAGSWVRLDSPLRYAWHRLLRIGPGFWVCLLVTALVVAPLLAHLTGRPASSVFTGPESAPDYLWANALLLMRQFGIAGLPIGVAVPDVVNGSLWTLFYEALCYAGLAALGLAGALRPGASPGRRALLPVAAGLFWALTALHAAGLELVPQQRILRLGLFFLAGAVLWAFADRVPVRPALAATSLAVVLATLLWLPDHRVAAPAFAYLCVYLAVVGPGRPTLATDISYGLYVYHWPVLQVLTVAGLPRLGAPVFVATALGLSLLAAGASWQLVERPALRFRNAFGGPARARAGGSGQGRVVGTAPAGAERREIQIPRQPARDEADLANAEVVEPLRVGGGRETVMDASDRRP